MQKLLKPRFGWFKYWILGAVLTIAASIGFLVTRTGPAAVSAPPTVADIAVNVSKVTGPMPYLYRAGLFTFSAVPPAYAQKKMLQELKPGAVELDIGSYAIQHSTSIDDIVPRLKEVGAFAQSVTKTGGQVVIAFHMMPMWLTSKPSERNLIPGERVSIANLSPPRDYELWANLVERVVKYFNKDLGLDAAYKIGWEPDSRVWQGSDEEYFKLYEYSVLGARRADARAKIGGPSVENFYAAHWKSPDAGVPMLYRFIEYCSRHALPSLGLTRLPIDFVVWHQFAASPLTTYSLQAATVRGWLKQFGYPEATPLMIGEWSSQESDNNAFSQERDMPFLASYIVANLVAMEQAGIKWHSFTSLLEQRVSDETEFGGGLGLLTKNLVTKPAFHAFALLSRLAGLDRLEVTSSDPFLTTIAGKDSNAIAVLIANHPYSDRTLFRMIIDKLYGKGHTTPELRDSLPMIVKVISGRTKPGDAGLSPRMSQDMASIISEEQSVVVRAAARQRTLSTVRLTLRGVSSGAGLTYERYLIDSNHGNARSQERKINAAVQNRRSVLDQDAQTEFWKRLPGEGFTDQDIRLMRDLIKRSRKEREAMAKSFTVQQMQKVQQAERLLNQVAMEATAPLSETINQWPEVKLQKVEEKQVVRSDALPLTFDLEPFGVTLVVLRPTAGKF